jgi:P pilus assembly chaperone PapD
MSKLVIACFFILFHPKAQAFFVNQPQIELTPTGRGTTSTIQVVNPSIEAVDISIYMKERAEDEFGKESRKDFDIKKYFLVLPTSLSIKPKSSASVRLIYIGPKDIKTEQAFRIIFASVKPQAFKQRPQDGSITADIQTLVSYASAVYVAPEGAASKIEFKGMVEKDGKPYYKIVNSGNKHVRLHNLKFTVKTTELKEPVQYDGSKFKGLYDPVFADSTRLLELPTDLKIPSKGSVSLELYEEK